MDDNQPNSTSDVTVASSVEEGSRGNGLQASSGAALEPVTLSYRASLEVDLKDGSKKLILDDARGRVAPGQMLAIMGPSGAGKTSLLNCLSLRNKAFKGSVLHNGKAPDMETVGMITAFVQQEDLFIPTLTPREHLRFHANLRMSKSITREEKMAAVERAIETLGLAKCTDTPIGGQGSTIRGISGGEKKRLSFATEVLVDSSVLFVDEPTSGLDSYMAEAVVTQLKTLAKSGHTIVATIHQPSSQVFNLFTHLHLLAEGKTAYCGPLDQATEFFDGIGHPCPSFYNPADHYIRVLSRDITAPQESERRINHAAEAYLSSQMRKEIEAELLPMEDIKNAAEDRGAAQGGSSKRVNQASWGSQVGAVYKRTLIMYGREPVLTRVRLAQAIVVAVIVGLIFLQLGISQADVQSTMGVLFFVAINQGILGTIGVLQVFPNEMPVFLREYDAGAYDVGPYFLGRTLAEIPIQFIFPGVFAIIIYLLTGLPLDAKPFLLFIVYVVLTSNAAVSLGYVVSALAKNVDVALALGPMILMPFVIFGGLLINIDEIPDYFVWMSIFSFVQYGFKGISIVVWEATGDLECPPDPNQSCAFETGEDVLEYLSIEGGNWQLWLNGLVLLALMVGFRILAYIALMYRARPTGERAY